MMPGIGPGITIPKSQKIDKTKALRHCGRGCFSDQAAMAV